MSMLLKDWLNEEWISDPEGGEHWAPSKSYKVDWKNGVQRFWDFYGIVTLIQKIKRAPQYADLDPSLLNVPYKMQTSVGDLNPIYFEKLREKVEDIGQQIIYTLGSDMNTYLKRACIMEFGHLIGQSDFDLSDSEDGFRDVLIAVYNRKGTLTQEDFKQVLESTMPQCPFVLALKLLKFGHYFSPVRCNNGKEIWDAYRMSVYGGKEPSAAELNIDDPRKGMSPDEDPEVAPKVAPSEPETEPKVPSDQPEEPEAEIEPPPEQDPELHEPSWTDKWIKDKLGNLIKEHGESYLQDVEEMLEESDIIAEEFLTEERLEKSLISKINHCRVKAGMSLQDIIDAYFYVPWSSAFGGPAWGIGLREGLKLWKMMNDKSDYEKIMLQIDHIYDLHHNTSVMLNKGDLFVPTEILDKRARITEMAALVPVAGPQVKALLIAASKYFYSSEVKENIKKFEIVRNYTDGVAVSAEQAAILKGWLFTWSPALKKYEAALEIESKTAPGRIQLYRDIPYYFLWHTDGYFYSGDGEGGRAFRDQIFEEAIKNLPPKDSMASEVRPGLHVKPTLVDKIISQHIRIRLGPDQEKKLRDIRFDWRPDSKRYKAKFLHSSQDNSAYLYAFDDGTFLYCHKINPLVTHKVFADFETAFAHCQSQTAGKVKPIDTSASPTSPTVSPHFPQFWTKPTPKPAAPPMKTWPAHAMTSPSLHVNPTELPPHPSSTAAYTAHQGIHTPPTQTIRLTQEDEQKLIKSGFEPKAVETDVWYIHKTVGDTIKFYPNNTAKIILVKKAKNTPPVITFTIEKMLAWAQTNYQSNSTESPLQIGAKPLEDPDQPETVSQKGTHAGMLFHKKLIAAGFTWDATSRQYKDGKNTLNVKSDKTSVLNISGGEVHKFNNMPELVAFLEDEYQDEKKSAKPTAEPPPEEKPSAVPPATPVAPPADTSHIVVELNHAMSPYMKEDGTISSANTVLAIIAFRNLLLAKMGEKSLKSNKVSLDASKWVVEHFPLFMDYVTANGVPPLEGTADQIEATITGWKAAQKPVLFKDKGKKLIKLMGQLGFKQAGPTTEKKGNIFNNNEGTVLKIYSDHTSVLMVEEGGVWVDKQFETIDQLILQLETMLGAVGATKEHHGVTQKEWQDLSPTISQHGFLSTWNSGQGQQSPYISIFHKPPNQQTLVCTIGALGNYYQINDAQDKPVGTYYSFQDLLEALTEFLLDEANPDFGPSPEEPAAESPIELPDGDTVSPTDPPSILTYKEAVSGLMLNIKMIEDAFHTSGDVMFQSNVSPKLGQSVTGEIQVKLGNKVTFAIGKINHGGAVEALWYIRQNTTKGEKRYTFMNANTLFQFIKEHAVSLFSFAPIPEVPDQPTKWQNVFSDENYGKDYPVEEKDITEIKLNDHDTNLLASIGFVWDEKEEYYIKDVVASGGLPVSEDIVAGEPYYEVVTCYNTGNAIWEKTEDPTMASGEPNDPDVKQGPIKEILNFVWKRWGGKSSSSEDTGSNLFDYKNYPNTKTDNLAEDEGLMLNGPDHQAALAQGFEWMPDERSYHHPNKDQFQVKNNGWTWYYIDGKVGNNTTDESFKIIKAKYNFQPEAPTAKSSVGVNLPELVQRVKAKVPTHYALTAHYGYTWIEGVKVYQKGTSPEDYVVFTSDGKSYNTIMKAGGGASQVDFLTDASLLKYLDTKNKLLTKVAATLGKKTSSSAENTPPFGEFDYNTWGEKEIAKGTYTKSDTIQLLVQDTEVLQQMGYVMEYTGASKLPKHSNVYNGPNDTHILFNVMGEGHWWVGPWDDKVQHKSFASVKEALTWLWQQKQSGLKEEKMSYKTFMQTWME